MTLSGEPRVWLERFPRGQPVPFSVDHLGLRYSGEIIRADQWTASWGTPLAGDIFFRVVLLRQRRMRRLPRISDPRIALCLPRSGLVRRRNQLAGELATIQETQAVYLTQRNAGADLVRTTLQRRRTEVEEQLLEEESIRYSEGEILTGSGLRPDPGALFAGSDPVTWFSRLAVWLLANAYPTLPIDGPALPRPVTADDVPALHQAIFNQPGASRGILGQLARGLGLYLLESPEFLDLSASPVAALVRDRLARGSLPTQWSDLHRYLSHDVGLTGPLASLYLVLYLFWEKPELEVRLAPGHRLTLASGRRLPGARLTGDLVPSLLWSSEIDRWAVTLGPATAPRWNDALMYLSALSPGLDAVGEDENFPAQERILLDSLETLGQELGRAQSFLRALAKPGTGIVADQEALLTRLSSIRGDDFISVYHSVRRVFRDYRLLETDLFALRRLTRLARWEGDILKSQEYLRLAEVPPRLAGLFVQRQALQEAMSAGALLQSSRGWEALAPEVARFKTAYAAAYREHHQRLHQSLPAYRGDFQSAGRKMRAHTLLNTLPALGEPTGAGLSDSLERLDQGPVMCIASGDNVDLEAVPWCQACRLTLQRRLPTDELARLLSATDRVLGEKNRRLSNLLVERILQGKTDQRLEELLTIVRASDLSALSNTLSEDLMAFIRQLLG